MLPLPTLPGAPTINLFNWQAAGTYQVAQRQVSARIDHAISENHRMFARFGRLQRHQMPPRFFSGAIQYPGWDTVTDSQNLMSSVSVDDTYVFSPSLVGSLRYGLSRKRTVNAGGSPGVDPADLHLSNFIIANQTLKGYPVIDLGENMPVLGNNGNTETDDVHAVLATFTKMSGKHSLKFGFDGRLVHLHINNPGAGAAGTFAFRPTFTQADPYTARSADTSGTAMAAALLAAPSSGSFGYGSPVSLQNYITAGFMQHDWKAAPWLTLNFGLRYELETPYTERYNRVSYGFDSGAKLPVQVPGMDLRGGLLFAGVNGNPRREGQIDKNNFGPRFGFALRLSHRLVVRGGYGLFYAGQSYNSGFVGQVGTFDAVTSYVGTVDNGATIFTTLDNPFPNGLKKPLGSTPGLMAQVGDSLSVGHIGRVSPYTQHWQFGLQKELPSRLTLEAAYLGMLSLKQLENFNLNEKPDRYLSLGAAENNRIPNSFLDVFPATSSLGQGATITQRQLWVAFPQFNSLSMNSLNTGRAIYHGLQVKVEKRLTKGLSFMWNYAFSKLIDNNTSSVVNPRYWRTVSGANQPHNMKMAFTYAMPIRIAGDGYRRLLRQAAEKWTLSGWMSIQSGTPMSITAANGRPLRLRDPHYTSELETRLGDRRDASGNVLNPYFDINAFQPLPTQYMVSPEPPVIPQLLGPGLRRFNGSLFKTFPVKERVRLKLSIDADNLFNTPNRGGPGTNMADKASFGVITVGVNPRLVQGSLRLEF